MSCFSGINSLCISDGKQLDQPRQVHCQVSIQSPEYFGESFVSRYMYDYDGNGVLDQNDFECLAVRNTIMEGKGDW